MRSAAEREMCFHKGKFVLRVDFILDGLHTGKLTGSHKNCFPFYINCKKILEMYAYTLINITGCSYECSFVIHVNTVFCIYYI